ncbi:uncharacterized protein LOC123215363 [Mangifera indica]|uniref:uncharacterized protein LOC123215363 n=1 Tax=Mangifera indica TaxID=29780 RepID=UPI001CFA4DC0|nr:uncharacterized protein LOC123215363 [Mangifera indica]
MDSGLSWADQWDTDNSDLPASASEKNNNNGKDGSKNKSVKGLLSLKWIKELRKKTKK